MVKKKDEENKDLTRIEDLSEFLHQEDSDLDLQFDNFSPSADYKALEEQDAHEQDAYETEELEEIEEAPPEIPLEMNFEAAPESTETFDTTNDLLGSEFEFENESNEDASPEENLFEADSADEFLSDNPMASSTDAYAFENDVLEDVEIKSVESESYSSTPERFDDVKTFANNFSYGQVQGGGNPPFSIIIRHIKYKEEAEDILNLLKEFAIVTDVNEKETLMAIELGSLIIPQISEFTAIVLAHKLRRFDLDLEVGLSDEIHPSRSGETNPRGLLKKDSLKQNRTESFKLADLDNSISDIVVTTMSSIQGYSVESYIGVQTTFSIVEESELEKLQYVQRANREHTELFDFESTETSELSSEKAFKDYQNSFSLLYDDLTQQLKQKAFTQNANALLGLSFQLSPLNFERAQNRISAYQITCSATLAIICKENT